MDVLVIYDGTGIKAWLVGEALESAPRHCANGYPELLPSWEAGTLSAVELAVPEDELYHPELYEVRDGQVQRQAAVAGGEI